MANFCYGDGKKLGKALPQHKLMHDLLSNEAGKKKITIGTQTEILAKTDSEISCCCRQNDEIGKQILIQKVLNSVEKNVYKRNSTQNYQNLLASIRSKVVFENNEGSSCCSCSDTWSDNSTGDADTIHFPKETRNAMSMILSHNDCQPSPKAINSTKPCTWPGVAERMDYHLARDQKLINTNEMVAKITSKLSKNKLDI